MRVALAQLDSRLGDLDANRARARRTFADAAAAGADLVVFPELQLSGYAVVHTDRETACTADELAPLAADAAGASVLFGFHERSLGRSYNSAAYYEGGALVHVHRKLYLPETVADESLVFTPGERMRAFDTGFGCVAVLICNDAWQPVLPFLAAHEGARVLFMPACSSTFLPEAEPYWFDLTRFYAQMLECWVVFVNRVGDERGLSFWGGSHVVDPFGEVVAEAARFEEELLLVDIDPAVADERRRDVPLLVDPRYDVLRAEAERLGVVPGPLPGVVVLPAAEAGSDPSGDAELGPLF
ncbi:MAG TPA: nitrilase-related carbon-nitrogen hydrolase [Gaiellaceae bacterium]|nr:nitrilase-related carbon-nitrogen hydrolase [Gaiellaceae bacterium]